MAVLATIGSKYAAPIWKGTKGFFRNYANLVMGVEQTDVFTETLRASVKKDGLHNFFSNSKNALEVSKDAVKDKSLWQNIKHSLNPATWISDFKAAKAGGSGTLKSLGKTFFKKMPIIGNVVALAFAIPSIYSAFTDTKNGGGIGAGIKEILKTGVTLGAIALGAAIGGAVGGPIGGIVGACAIGWLASKLTGPSFNEAKEERLAKAGEEAQAQAQATKEGNSESAILPKPYTSPVDATGVTKPSFSGLTGLDSSLDLSGLTPEEAQTYAQLRAAYGAYSSGSGSSNFMDRDIYSRYPGQSVFS